jgi:hypothetical protein
MKRLFLWNVKLYLFIIFYCGAGDETQDLTNARKYSITELHPQPWNNLSYFSPKNQLVELVRRAAELSRC